MPAKRVDPLRASSKTLNRLKARGPAEILALAWERTRDWFRSGGTLIVFVVEAEPRVSDIPGVTFREATTADRHRYARDIGTDSESSFRSRLSEDTRCFLVDDGTLLVHASWVTTERAWTRELATYLSPPDGDAYIYESFTRPEARGRGIYPYVLRNIVSWTAEHGLRRAWVAVEAHNHPSIRSVTKAGFDEAFRISFTRRWGHVKVGVPYGSDPSEASTFMS